MKFSWERLAEHLRTELGELGGLIRLLELRRERELKRVPAALAEFEAALVAQATAVQTSRRMRENTLRTFPHVRRLPARTIPEGLLKEVEPEAQPLIQALGEEIERLDGRLHRLLRRLPAANQRKLREVMKSE
jgi:hypothetical protein